MLDKPAAARASVNLTEYSLEKGIYMKINGAFSVSHSDVDRVANYIARQEEHHRRISYAEEYKLFVKRYGLEWRDEGNR